MPFIKNSPLNYPPNSSDAIRRYEDNRAPTNSDFRAFTIGDEWLDTSTNDWWKLCYKDINQGIWRKMAGPFSSTELFTPDVGGQTGPDALNNINLVGGAGITTTGNPATNTLTISLTGGSLAIDSVTANAGGAVGPDATGNLNLVGTATNGINIIGNPGTFTQTVSMQSPYADGDFEFRNTAAATSRTLLIHNTNVNAASDAILALGVPAASADCFVRYTIDATTNYAWGIDNSDSDALKLTDSTTPSLGNTMWKMTTAGQRTLPTQPSFYAYLSADLNDVTGDATEYDVPFNTELYDIGGNFNAATGFFTAPVDGTYCFNSTLGSHDYALHNNYVHYIMHAAANELTAFNPVNVFRAAYPEQIITNISAIIFLTAGQMVNIRFRVDGGAKVIDVNSSVSSFSGFLLG